MNSKKAKRIRKEVYGDLSTKGERQYVESNHRRVKGGVSKTLTNAPGSLRAKYLKAKKEAVMA